MGGFFQGVGGYCQGEDFCPGGCCPDTSLMGGHCPCLSCTCNVIIYILTCALKKLNTSIIHICVSETTHVCVWMWVSFFTCPV